MPKVGRDLRKRGWCFTINLKDFAGNVDEAREELHKRLQPLGQLRDQFKYLVAGFEVGEQGTPHAQGYINFKEPTSWRTVRGHFHGAHVEAQKSPDDYDAAKYCWKDGDLLIEMGKRPTPGARTDIKELGEAVLAAAQAGTPFNQVAVAHPSQTIKYHRGMEALYRAGQASADSRTKPIFILIWGTSRSGKNRYIESRFAAGRYDKNPASRWWDGYGDQQVVHVEDWHPVDHHQTMPASVFKNLVSTSVVDVEVKNGRVAFKPRVIVITSNYNPRQWSNDQGVIEPLLGRVDLSVEITGPSGQWFNPQVMDQYVDAVLHPDYVYAGIQERQVKTWPSPIFRRVSTVPAQVQDDVNPFREVA